MNPAQINAYLAVREADSSCRIDRADYCLEADGDDSNAHWTPMNDRGDFIDEDLCDDAICNHLHTMHEALSLVVKCRFDTQLNDWGVYHDQRGFIFSTRDKLSAFLAAHIVRVNLDETLIKALP